MKGSVVASPIAVMLMVFYYFVPFAIEAGASDRLAGLRPVLIFGSVGLIVFGLLIAWQARKSCRRVFKLKLAVVCVSAFLVLAMLLFPQAIANLLARWVGST